MKVNNLKKYLENPELFIKNSNESLLDGITIISNNKKWICVEKWNKKTNYFYKVGFLNDSEPYHFDSIKKAIKFYNAY